MGHSDFLLDRFLSRLPFDPTPCQDSLLRKVADFVSSDDNDILVVNGYAGTGKILLSGKYLLPHQSEVYLQHAAAIPQGRMGV